MIYLLFDIGGTKMRLSYSFDGENLHDVSVFPTPQEFEKAIEIISSFVTKNADNDPNKKVSCGLPGILSGDKATLLRAPNLPFWINKPIKKELDNITKSDVFLENDAYLAGVGESVHGAGKESEVIAYLTFGTGVGGARISKGVVEKLTWGFEPGHQIIDISGSILGKVSDLEILVGGKNIERRFGMKPEEISDGKIWDEIEKYIAASVVNSIVYWSPETVILGGGLMESKNISLTKIIEKTHQMLNIYPVFPQVKMWELGDRAALLGGLDLLKKAKNFI